jgi:hypothetical protein
MRKFLSLCFICFIVACKKEHPPASLPTLTALEITNITTDSCLAAGKIIADGNRVITRKGICYGLNGLPSLNDNVIEYQGSAALFTLPIKGLSPNTTYYVRAFATNEVGTAYSNNQMIFKTLISSPSIGSLSIADISSTSVECEVAITTSGGAQIISRGVCYNTSPGPTLENNVVVSSSNADIFSVTINKLVPQTTYYIRAFASNSSGITYSNEVTINTPAQIFALGNSYQGGIIFYLDDSGIHGLLAAPNDQNTNVTWGCFGVNLSGADDSFIGTGLQNTQDIIAGCNVTNTAAYYCRNLVLSDYDDWFLPSKDELELMYINLHAFDKGNFSGLSYWSSTEVDANNAWSHHFGTNAQSESGKNSPFAVRAIRAF